MPRQVFQLALPTSPAPQPHLVFLMPLGPTPHTWPAHPHPRGLAHTVTSACTAPPPPTAYPWLSTQLPTAVLPALSSPPRLPLWHVPPPSCTDHGPFQGCKLCAAEGSLRFPVVCAWHRGSTQGKKTRERKQGLRSSNLISKSMVLLGLPLCLRSCEFNFSRLWLKNSSFFKG